MALEHLVMRTLREVMDVRVGPALPERVDGGNREYHVPEIPETRDEDAGGASREKIRTVHRRAPS